MKYLILILIMTTQLLHARIGLSEKKCNERYGKIIVTKDVTDVHKVILYKKNDNVQVVCYIYKNKCFYIIYIIDNPSGKFISAICEINLRRKLSALAHGTNDAWVTVDKKYMITKANTSVEISKVSETIKMLKMLAKAENNKQRAKDEKDLKEDLKGL